MAVVDIYSQADKESGNGKRFPAVNGSGTETFTVVGTSTVAAGDDDTSKYRVLFDIPSNAVPINICIHNTAITAGTDYDLGLYETDSGAVIDADILADGIDLSSAATIATWNNTGMTTIDIANGTQTLGTLSAQTDVASSYDIVLTANTVGSAAGTIRVTAEFALL